MISFLPDGYIVFLCVDGEGLLLGIVLVFISNFIDVLEVAFSIKDSCEIATKFDKFFKNLIKQYLIYFTSEMF